MKNYLTAEAAKELAKAYEPPPAEPTTQAPIPEVITFNSWGRRQFRKVLKDIRKLAKQGQFHTYYMLSPLTYPYDWQFKQWGVIIDKLEELGYHLSGLNNKPVRASLEINISWREPTK